MPSPVPFCLLQGLRQWPVKFPSQVVGGALGGPAASLQYTVSLVQWVNCLLLALGGRGLHPGDAPTLTMEPCSPVSNAIHYLQIEWNVLIDRGVHWSHLELFHNVTLIFLHICCIPKVEEERIRIKSKCLPLEFPAIPPHNGLGNVV
jgi:hypothetical protein